MMTIQQFITAASDVLTRSENPRLDIEILLAQVLNKSRSYIVGFNDSVLTETQYQQAMQLIERRQQGEPIAYLLGEREFWSLPLKVSPATLIPRHETELLVELALSLLPLNENSTIIDMGTGSGAIALALAADRPCSEVWAVDIAEEALNVAKYNAMHLELNNVHFIRSNLFNDFSPTQLAIKVSMVVSNPPYLAENDEYLLLGDLPFEPRHALVSGKTGLEVIQKLVEDSPQFLKPAGWFLCEHGYAQGKAVRTLFQQRGYENVQTWRDLAGQERVTGGQWNE